MDRKGGPGVFRLGVLASIAVLVSVQVAEVDSEVTNQFICHPCSCSSLPVPAEEKQQQPDEPQHDVPIINVVERAAGYVVTCPNTETEG